MDQLQWLISIAVSWAFKNDIRKGVFLIRDWAEEATKETQDDSLGECGWIISGFQHLRTLI